MDAPSSHDVHEDVRRALREDLGNGDLTAALVDQRARAEATVISRQPGVVCGRPWFDATFELLDGRIGIDWRVAEGQRIEANQVLCTLSGPARALLSGERTALNFLQTLSATASVTRRYVDAVGDNGVEVLDTRKTLPGLRRAQKYAVRCGGGRNHRMGLYDGVLIKENHIEAMGSVGAAVAEARSTAPKDVPIEVEVEDLHQVHEALAAGADILLLDNMDIDTLTEAVAITRDRAKLEASGGVVLENIGAIAQTGVDFISVGSLTKDVQALDLSMRFGYVHD